MRLIDADIADVVIICDKCNELTQVSAIREYIKRQKAFLDKFPTIDAVPVVRCKDCKYCDISLVLPTGREMYTCMEGSHDHQMLLNPTDYCSYGVRKGEDNDD